MHLVSRGEGIRSVMKITGSATWKFPNLLAKTIGTLSAVTVFHVLVSAVGFCAPDGARDSFAKINSPRMSGIESLHAIGRAILIIDSAENALLATDLDDKKRQIIYSRFDAANRILTESLEACGSLPWSPEKARIWDDFGRALQRWSDDHERFMELARAHEKSRTVETYKSMSVQALEVNPVSLSGAVILLDAAIEVSYERQEERSDMAETDVSSYQEHIIRATVLGVSLSAAAMIVLLVRRARRHRRLFRMGDRRLSLDVDRYRNLFSYVHSPKNGEESE